MVDNFTKINEFMVRTRRICEDMFRKLKEVYKFEAEFEITTNTKFTDFKYAIKKLDVYCNKGANNGVNFKDLDFSGFCFDGILGKDIFTQTQQASLTCVDDGSVYPVDKFMFISGPMALPYTLLKIKVVLDAANNNSLVTDFELNLGEPTPDSDTWFFAKLGFNKTDFVTVNNYKRKGIKPSSKLVIKNTKQELLEAKKQYIDVTNYIKRLQLCTMEFFETTFNGSACLN